MSFDEDWAGPRSALWRPLPNRCEKHNVVRGDGEHEGCGLCMDARGDGVETAVALISAEIAWCEANRDPARRFQDGFVAGLRQAQHLLKAAAAIYGPPT